ncbi:profilin-1 isoform X1 [Osmerus eperlanus]|uniref:profilin-1 isoform X1 n=1 Tax=Osmerus eperlanus TaxID=29151 RepID=UPI002E15C115
MSGWDSWLASLTAGEKTFQEGAIVGHEPGAESVWTATPGGKLANITAAEIKMLVGKDRSPLFSGALTVGGVKCTALRDTLLSEDAKTLDLKTKVYDGQPDTFGISIAKTPNALVICKGQKETHGGVLNKRVSEVAEQLRTAGY